MSMKATTHGPPATISDSDDMTEDESDLKDAQFRFDQKGKNINEFEFIQDCKLNKMDDKLQSKNEEINDELQQDLNHKYNILMNERDEIKKTKYQQRIQASILTQCDEELKTNDWTENEILEENEKKREPIVGKSKLYKSDHVKYQSVLEKHKNLKIEHAKLRIKNEEKQKQIEALVVEIYSVKYENKKLKSEIKENSDASMKKHEELQMKYNKVNTKNEENKNDLESTTKENEKLNKQNADTLKELLSYYTDYDKMTAEQNKLSAKYKTLLNETEALNTKKQQEFMKYKDDFVAEMKEKFKNIEEEINELQTENDKLNLMNQQNVKRLESETNKNTKLKANNDHYDAVQNELNERNEKYKALEKQLIAVKNNMNLQKKKAEEYQKRIEAKNKDLSQNVAEITSKCDALLLDRNRLKQICDDNANKLKEKTKNNDTLRMKYNDSKEKHEATLNALEALRVESHKYENTRTRFVNETKFKQQTIEWQQNDSRSTKEEKQESGQVRIQYRELQSNYNKLEADHEREKSENKNKQQTIGILQNELNKIRIKALKEDEMNYFRVQLQHTENSMKITRKQLDELKQKIAMKLSAPIATTTQYHNYFVDLLVEYQSNVAERYNKECQLCEELKQKMTHISNRHLLNDTH